MCQKTAKFVWWIRAVRLIRLRKLTDNPLHFASVVSAVANGGYYNFPTLNINSKDNKRAFSAKTAQTLKEYMKYVVDNGTGFNAQYKSNTAGKTATAQTGIYEDGKEQLKLGTN